MVTYEVTLQGPTGRQRVERVTASSATSASNQALLRVTRELGKGHGWMVLHAIEAQS